MGMTEGKLTSLVLGGVPHVAIRGVAGHFKVADQTKQSRCSPSAHGKTATILGGKKKKNAWRMLSPVEGGLAVAVELLELVHLGKESELCNKHSTNSNQAHTAPKHASSSTLVRGLFSRDNRIE